MGNIGRARKRGYFKAGVPIAERGSTREIRVRNRDVGVTQRGKGGAAEEVRRGESRNIGEEEKQEVREMSSGTRGQTCFLRGAAAAAAAAAAVAAAVAGSSDRE
ncbi:hypothetical protein KM043_008920 [Ampulex compressa]|nr:hypothetical protein KM043_008920 [Ampulex compressa]